MSVFKLLKLGGHDVTVIHDELWVGERYEVPNNSKSIVFKRALRIYPKLLWRFIRSPKSDVVFVLYPGWFDTIIFGVVAKFRRMPVVLDMFISLSDTAITDRKLVKPRSFVGSICRWADKLSMRIANRVITDTPEVSTFYAKLARCHEDKFDVVWIGANDDVFQEVSLDKVTPGRVLFHGTFIKLQGIDTIVRAAKLLDNDPVDIKIIGTGQEQESITALVEELQPKNLQLIGSVSLQDLLHEIASAEICLGIFGPSEKVARVIPNKVFEEAAVGRPIITGDTAGMRSGFTDNDLAMVPRGDHVALADQIRSLHNDEQLRSQLAKSVHKTYVEKFDRNSLQLLLDGVIARAIADN